MINRILEKIIDIKSLDLVSILGVADCNLKLIQSVIPVSIIARGHKIKITGNEGNVDKVNQIFYEMIETLNSKGCLLYTSPSPRDMRRSRMPSSA